MIAVLVLLLAATNVVPASAGGPPASAGGPPASAGGPPAEAGATSAPDASSFVGSPQGAPIAGARLDKRTIEVAGLLRCPVCQGLSVADSPAQMAVNMKGQVRELLSRGYTEKQILRYFEMSYGQFVLLQPKFEGINVLVWLLPLLAVIGGAWIVRIKVRKLGKPAIAATQSASDDPYLAQVRNLVGGKS